MARLLEHSDENPDFARVVELARLRDTEEFAFDISPDAAESVAIAKLLGAKSVRKIRFRGTLSPLPKTGWLLEGQLGATAIQSCVISLEPVTTRVDQPVERSYLPETESHGPEYMIPEDDDNDREILGNTIDLGLLAIEILALALPDYPRKEGISMEKHTFAEKGVRPLEDRDVKPFAALAQLRDKLADRS